MGAITTAYVNAAVVPLTCRHSQFQFLYMWQWNEHAIRDLCVRSVLIIAYMSIFKRF